MEQVASESKQKTDIEILSFSGDGRLFPIEPNVMKVGARLNIVNMESDAFGTAIFPIRTGKIINIIPNKNTIHIKAKFKRQKKYTKEETINYLLQVTQFKEDKLKKTFEKAFRTNFSIEDLKKIAESNNPKFETPKEIARYNDGIYLKIGNTYYKM